MLRMTFLAILLPMSLPSGLWAASPAVTWRSLTQSTRVLAAALNANDPSLTAILYSMRGAGGKKLEIYSVTGLASSIELLNTNAIVSNSLLIYSSNGARVLDTLAGGYVQIRGLDSNGNSLAGVKIYVAKGFRLHRVLENGAGLVLAGAFEDGWGLFAWDGTNNPVELHRVRGLGKSERTVITDLSQSNANRYLIALTKGHPVKVGLSSGNTELVEIDGSSARKVHASTGRYSRLLRDSGTWLILTDRSKKLVFRSLELAVLDASFKVIRKFGLEKEGRGLLDYKVIQGIGGTEVVRRSTDGLDLHFVSGLPSNPVVSDPVRLEKLGLLNLWDAASLNGTNYYLCEGVEVDEFANKLKHIFLVGTR